ncbi:hypothetical protein HHE03_08750 [Helicobacter heilmannii]|uniref:PBECR3 domain-containing polyvalent protein n=1 Tax=Helicobacter heilmannii TaxID=35817 RepID=UPI0006A0C717|nr:hypothetical protein [Helicobacter heilmannii]CRF49271.1 hypothetical protein HHE03_08750 [Helicobacter heilmannii]
MLSKERLKITTTLNLYNGKNWEFKARIDWTNNNDPSQPRRWVLQDFKVIDTTGRPKPPTDKPPRDTGSSGGSSGGAKGGGDSKDLLDPTKPLRMARPEEITPELLNKVKDTNAKIWVGDLNNTQILEHLGLDNSKPVKMLFDGNALKHIEKRHGPGSNLVEISKQPAVTIEDIKTYPDIVNGADLMRIEDTKDQQKALVIGKQINGYFITIEIISKKITL